MSGLPDPVFPPLFHGEPAPGRADPFAKARAEAMLGCDSGLVVYRADADMLRAAVVFAPEVALDRAMAVVIACGVGFQNALGALAPPEVAVHLGWTGEILVNGARCGGLRVAASTVDPRTEPDWLVVGLEVPLLPPGDVEPGMLRDSTCLFEEGCAEVEPIPLLESWVRHSLLWINTWLEAGNAPLHAEWLGLVHGIGAETEIGTGNEVHRGVFLGTDEDFGMLLRQGDDTRLLPLRTILETGDIS